MLCHKIPLPFLPSVLIHFHTPHFPLLNVLDILCFCLSRLYAKLGKWLPFVPCLQMFILQAWLRTAGMVLNTKHLHLCKTHKTLMQSVFLATLLNRFDYVFFLQLTLKYASAHYLIFVCMFSKFLPGWALGRKMKLFHWFSKFLTNIWNIFLI